MYSCGPTTYNFIHLGNARALVVFDTIRRYLIYKGYRVTFIQNFTDIDDKIIKRAREENMDTIALAAKYVNEYFTDADALNVMRADVHPKVSEHLPEIVEMIGRLIERGIAYTIPEGDVYFSVRDFPGYGKLSGRSLDDMLAGARVEVDPRKRDAMDFALWKSAKPDEPAWDSPWGPGRPGWHIECSAMSLKYLGESFDIHGGGADLIFPHHENEIAQSEGATGKPFARYWVHNGFITIREEKMSKSIGNISLVRDLVKVFEPAALRSFLLSTHYRSQLDFDPGKMDAAVKGVNRLKTCLNLLEEGLTRADDSVGTNVDLEKRLEELRERFESAMDDDFNSALAQAVLFDLASEINSYLHQTAQPEQGILLKARTLFTAFNGVLGVFREENGRIVLKEEAGSDDLVAQLLDLIIGVREESRKKKDFATSDRIRDELKAIGIVLEDTPQGVRWKRN
jgi:cysteinyl-tRNA synthetase